MTCDICGKEIPRGKRYIGPRYKTEHFCSEECYLKRQPKIDNDRRKLTDYIKSWIAPPDYEWVTIISQINSLEKETNLTDMDLRRLLKFCHEYIEVPWNREYGIKQFLYYWPQTQEFMGQLVKTKNDDTDLTDNYITISPIKKNNRRWREELDF